MKRLTLCLSVFFFSSVSLGWGLHKGFNDAEIREAYLLRSALSSGEIRYCISIDPSVRDQFSLRSMQLQTESALRQWLRPVLDQNFILQIQSVLVSCADKHLQLLVEIGPESQYPGLGAYQLETFKDNRWISRIKIDTGFQWEKYSWQDFDNFRKHQPLISFVDFELSKDVIFLRDFARAFDLDEYAVFWSTYRVLLHELGHSFGLCDTYRSQRDVNCDPDYLKPDYRGSVMSDSYFLNLTEDDKAGILAALKRSQEL